MDLETIDWALALKQMGNDAPFLMEVLSDVLVEAKDMLPALQTAINTRNGDVVAAAGAQLLARVAYCLTRVQGLRYTSLRRRSSATSSRASQSPSRARAST